MYVISPFYGASHFALSCICVFWNPIRAAFRSVRFFYVLVQVSSFARLARAYLFLFLLFLSDRCHVQILIVFF